MTDSPRDRIDEALDAWSVERPDFDLSAAAITLRLVLLGKYVEAHATRSFAPYGLQPWEADVLSALLRQGAPYTLSAGELARSLLLTCGGMTHRLDRLEERGLVERRPSPEDRRSVLVSLTPQGLATTEEALERRMADVNELMKVLDGSERKHLNELLRRLSAALESMDIGGSSCG